MKNLKLKIYKLLKIETKNHYIISVFIEKLNERYYFTVSVVVTDFNKPIGAIVFLQYAKKELLEEFGVSVELNEISFDFISLTGTNY